MISIIIPLYNKQDTICESVKSALSQTMSDIEVLVVDDGSTDDSVCRLSQLADHRLRIIRKKNGGVSSARNYGINKAKGDWIIFLDADDLLLPNCVEILYGLVNRYSTIAASANFYKESKGSKKLALHKFKKEGKVEYPFWAWATNQFFPRTGNTLIKTEIFKEHIFDETLNRSEDAKQIFELMRKYRFAYSPIPIMVYKQDNCGLSMQNCDIYKNYVFHLDFNNKSIGERIVYCLMIRFAILTYPDSKNILLDKYKKHKLQIFFSRIIVGVFSRILNRLEKNDYTNIKEHLH